MSDLHFGAGNGLDDPRLEQAIGDLVERVSPDVVVASGDLTHRGLRSEHEAAATYLRALGRPLLVIPGNHDIPTWPPGRFTHPYREFERCWGTTSPSFSAPGLEIAGLCSVQPLGYQRGHVKGHDLERAEAQLRAAPEGALRVATLHHQLTGAPWRNTKLPVKGRKRLLAAARRRRRRADPGRPHPPGDGRRTAGFPGCHRRFTHLRDRDRAGPRPPAPEPCLRDPRRPRASRRRELAHRRDPRLARRGLGADRDADLSALGSGRDLVESE